MKNMDLSGLTEEQQQEVAVFAEFAKSKELKTAMAITALAEHYLGSIIVHENRPAPVNAANSALAYAQAMHEAGEAFMQEEFAAWREARASRPTEPAPEPAPDSEVEFTTPEVVTKADADADTEAREAQGEALIDPSN